MSQVYALAFLIPTLKYQAAGMSIIDFYFSLSVLVFAVATSFYFLFEWLNHRSLKIFLFWSIGLFSIYLFKIPNILANAGFGFILQEFNFIFTITSILSFLAQYLLFLGIASVSPLRHQQKINRFLGVWLGISSVFIIVYFWSGSRLAFLIPNWVNFLFYLPFQIILAYAVLKWFLNALKKKTKSIYAGFIVLEAASLVGILTSFLYMKRMISYLPQFWFIAAISSRLISILQSVGILAFIAGFLLLHGYIRKAALAERSQK